MRSRTAVLTSVLFCALAATVSAQWIKQNVNTTASFRGLSVVNEKVVWASGIGGTVIRTIDGGKTWDVMTVPGAEKLDFRDIEAFDAKTAYILSIGSGDSSRIYKTTDGGKNWNLLFKNTDQKAFYDAIACWDAQNCIAISDPVDGSFLIRQVRYTGMDYSVALLPAKIPSAKAGEAAFAASGTCLIARGRKTAFLVTGGSSARVFKSTDRGLSWTVAETPIVHGTTGSGIFSIAMFDANNGVIVGGNYEKPDEANNNIAFTSDSGMTWKLGDGLTGYRSAVDYIDSKTVIAVGTNGSNEFGSPLASSAWNKTGEESLNAVRANGVGAIWAAGPNGMVVKHE